MFDNNNSKVAMPAFTRAKMNFLHRHFSPTSSPTSEDGGDSNTLGHLNDAEECGDHQASYDQDEDEHDGLGTSPPRPVSPVCPPRSGRSTYSNPLSRSVDGAYHSSRADFLDVGGGGGEAFGPPRSNTDDYEEVRASLQLDALERAVEGGPSCSREETTTQRERLMKRLEHSAKVLNFNHDQAAKSTEEVLKVLSNCSETVVESIVRNELTQLWLISKFFRMLCQNPGALALPSRTSSISAPKKWKWNEPFPWPVFEMASYEHCCADFIVPRGARSLMSDNLQFWRSDPLRGDGSSCNDDDRNGCVDLDKVRVSEMYHVYLASECSVSQSTSTLLFSPYNRKTFPCLAKLTSTNRRATHSLYIFGSGTTASQRLSSLLTSPSFQPMKA